MKTYTKSDIADINPRSLIGTDGSMQCESLTVKVIIRDVRTRFGHIDFLVEPLNGEGEQWVELHRIRSLVPTDTN